MRGADVRMLQQTADRRGACRPPSTASSAATPRARVRSWERNSGRRVDGRVSRRDARALQSSVERGERLPAPASRSRRPSAAPTAPGDAGDDRARRPRGRARLGARRGQGDDRRRQRDPRQAVQVRRRSRELERHAATTARARCPTCSTRPDCSTQALDSTGFMSWGEAGKGTVGHELRELRPLLHGDRRPALRHQRPRRRRLALGHRDALVERLHGPPPRRARRMERYASPAA